MSSDWNWRYVFSAYALFIDNKRHVIVDQFILETSNAVGKWMFVTEIKLSLENKNNLDEKWYTISAYSS